MSVSPLAGKTVEDTDRADITALVADYYTVKPSPDRPAERVAFGTSGHRGQSATGSFNEDHILAVSQAIVEYRSRHGITGPLYIGRDTHALSLAAYRTALQVLVAGGVTPVGQTGDGFTPTPAISRAILLSNRDAAAPRADGIVITPSHNPPEDGGFKYNPPAGGPAGVEETDWIEARANELLADGLRGVSTVSWNDARKELDGNTIDLMADYVRELDQVLDMEAIRYSGVRLAVDPLGGASLRYWELIAEHWGLDLEVVNTRIDPAFGFMTYDHDGRIRMDCSSPYAMAGLLRLAGDYTVAIGNDPDADRHGIVTREGLLNPNHYLAVSVDYLFRHRPGWPAGAGVGKTLVSSSLIDRVAAALGRPLFETPVGFKWFTDGLLDGSLGFAGEESAGASFLRRDGQAWSTDKDGIIMGLLAAEITAVTDRSPYDHYRRLVADHGEPAYARSEAPATPEQKAALAALSPDDVTASELAGDEIRQQLTAAPGNGEPIGGLKVVTDQGWFAARPSGTEDVYKIYAESLRGREHLDLILFEARKIVDGALRRA